MFNKLLHQFQHLSRTDREYVLSKLKQIDDNKKLESVDVLHELFCPNVHDKAVAGRCMYYEDIDEYNRWIQKTQKILDTLGIEDSELSLILVDCCKATAKILSKVLKSHALRLANAYFCTAYLLDLQHADLLLGQPAYNAEPNEANAACQPELLPEQPSQLL